MLTDGARPWESVAGYSPLLWLKAFVCPLSRQPAMQGCCLAAAAAQHLQPPACLSAAPHRANTGYSGRGAGLFRIQPLLLAVCTLLASGALGCAAFAWPRSRSPLLWARRLHRRRRQRCQGTAPSCHRKGLPAWRDNRVGGCTPPSRKQQQRSAGGNSEQVVQELAGIF